jgi:hypothetical protein
MFILPSVYPNKEHQEKVSIENASSISLARSENTTNHVEKKWNYKTEEQQLVNNKNITLDRKESLCVGKHATS